MNFNDMTDEARKASYLARSAARREADSLKMLITRTRQKHSDNLQAVLDYIESHGSATRDEISTGMDKSETTIKVYIVQLHRGKRIYICDWVWQDGRRTRMPSYRIGKKKDVPMPPIKFCPPEHKAMDEEALAKADARRKHDAWLKEWRPHVDPAAAWMMNPVA
jgi:hypothetical protein